MAGVRLAASRLGIEGAGPNSVPTRHRHLPNSFGTAPGSSSSSSTVQTDPLFFSFSKTALARRNSALFIFNSSP